jgi:predicted unusual protein kinase regulating ubiquinone biosynthesis (AarF/ABC1/UbiB family)
VKHLDFGLPRVWSPRAREFKTALARRATEPEPTAHAAAARNGSRGRLGRAIEVGKTARRARVLRLLRELGVVGSGAPPTREGAQELRRAFEELGTTYVKLGQLLSSRPELLPDVYIEELSQLTDSAPPVSFSAIEPVIAQDVGLDAFTRIDPEPLASASIAQVHRALMRDGRDVVVKVRLPGIEEQVEVDLELLRSAANLLERRSETARAVQARALAEELEVHLRGELNLLEEAHNAELIAGLAASEEAIVVPAVVRPHVSERVLVLERIEGKKIAADHGLPPERASLLAERFFGFYVRQVTLEGFYHADPHRGNVLLTPDGRLALLDFGLLGRVDDDTRRSLAMLLLAVAQNRADDVADQILGLSLTLLDADEPGFIHELRRKLPRYHWRALSDIRSGEALADLQRIAIAHGIRLPTSFALVGKTLAQADEIARTLDPQLDPVRLIREQSFTIVSSELRSRLEPDALLAFLAPQLDEVAKLPRRVGHVVERLETGTLKVGIVPTDLTDLEHIMRSTANRVGMALIIVGLLLASALMASVSHSVALGGFCLAAVLALYMIWKIIRTPGEL